jgi:hypothetical protein
MSADRPSKPPPQFDGQRDTWDDLRQAAPAPADALADEDTSDDLPGLDHIAFDAVGAAAELDAALAEDTDHGPHERAAQKDAEQHTRKIVLGFIDVLDDLDRAIAAAGQAAAGTAVLEGMELVRKRFLARLADLDVHHVPAVNTPFDPNQHEAMSVVNTTDPAQDGVVIGVMREGYRIGNDTLRPAGVAVGKHTPAQP